MQNLEQIVEKKGNFEEDDLFSRESKTFSQRAKDVTTNYLVDVSAGISFYAPIMATGEHFLAGMDGPEVLKSRLGSAVMQLICMRPIGMLRNASAKYFGLIKESPWYQKTASDVASTLAIQLPTYALALHYSGASLEEGTKALALGSVVTTVSGRLFGRYMDGWRKMWGKKPAIK